jgi:DNA invertase Pin-like site-specific DNA recombinase
MTAPSIGRTGRKTGPRQRDLPNIRRAWGYVRVSTEAQSDSGISIDEQQVKIRARALENNWNLEHVYIDAGVSGGTPLAKRPEGAKLLAVVRPGDVIVAAKLDRMFRNALDALQTMQSFRERKISLWLLDLGNDCTGNGIAELIMTVLAAVAQFERGLISERIKDAKRNLKRQRRHLGGTRPFGYNVTDDKQLVPAPEEQAAIAAMVTMRTAGAGLMVIRDAMRERGFPISHETVRQALRRHAEEQAV